VAATSQTRSYNAFLTSTRDKYLKTAPTNAIIKTNPTFAYLNAKSRVRTLDGGAKIQVPLMYGKNTTAASISPYQTFDISPQDGITSAFYDYAEYVVSVSIDNLSLKQNQGPHAAFDLMKAKTDQATRSLSEKLNIDLLAIEGLTTSATGNGGKNLISIPMYFPKTAAASCSIDVGAIDMSVEKWWAPDPSAVITHSATTIAGTLKDLYTCRAHASKLAGNGMPDFSITHVGMWTWLNMALDTKTRYQGTASKANTGFDSLSVQGMEVFWDAHMPDYTQVYDYGTSGAGADYSIVMLNSDFLELGFLRGMNFDWTPFQQPEDQLARVSTCVAAGNLLCSNRASGGIVFSIDVATVVA
jgi:hypothetical protein